MKKLLLIPAFLFLLSPFLMDAQAQEDYDWEDDNDNGDVENVFGIGPRLGYYSSDNFEDGTFYYGLQARVRMNEVLGLEGAVEYRPATEASFTTPDGGSVETKFVPVTGSLLVYLPLDANIAPYGLGGVGGYYTMYDTDEGFEDIDSEFNFGYHLGFGIELPTNSDVSLSLDYRYLFLTSEGENLPEDAEFSGNAFTASLMFYL